MDRSRIRTILQIVSWIMGTAIVAAAVLYLVKRSNSIMNSGKDTEYIGRPEADTSVRTMTPETLFQLGKISSPALSPDGEYIIYSVAYTSIKENRSCSNLFICRTDGTGKQQLTASGKSISNARWSRDGRKILYLKQGQIWAAGIKLKNGEWRLSREVRLSDIRGGVSEFSISPDEKKIMYVSTAEGPAGRPGREYSDLPRAHAFSADGLMYRHWDHWVTEIPHTFVAGLNLKSVKTGTITRENSSDMLSEQEKMFELPAEPFSGIEQLDWSPDGKFIAYSCRKLSGIKYAFSTNTDIFIYRTADGATFRVTDGGGYDTQPVWSPDGSRLCWLSMARDGYEADKQRLMVADITVRNDIPTAENVRDLTADFKYNAAGPVWDGKDGIIFNALAEGLQALFRANPSDGTVSRLTGDDLWFDFSSPFGISTGKGNGAGILFTTRTSMNFPAEIISIEMPEDGSAADSRDIKEISKENADLLSSLEEPGIEARMIRTVDGKEMLTWILTPPGFDPSKKYPAILICLGGPQGTLSQGWSYRWNYRLMASMGYVVILPNRRGTTAFGQEWTEQISGDYCGLNIQDYLSAAKEMKKEPYIGKMAACGASYGGFSVYYLSGVHGNTFDAFVAHAGIFNEEHMYMTTEEMWFANWDNGGLHEFEADPAAGTPDGPTGPAGDGETFGGVRQGGSPWSTSPAARRHYANSPHKLVTNWHTPILITHGGMDFRVPSEQGLAAFNAAQLMGVESRLIIFPDENHWILKPQNSLYWHREYFKWLDKWCKEN